MVGIVDAGSSGWLMGLSCGAGLASTGLVDWLLQLAGLLGSLGFIVYGG